MMLKWSVLLLAACVLVEGQQGYPRFIPSVKFLMDVKNATVASEVEDLSRGENLTLETKSLDRDRYPNLPEEFSPATFANLRKSSFSCSSQTFPGYYADPETDCQVFHICQTGGRVDSFLCPNETGFNQEKLVCDWRYNFDCNRARDFYVVNEVIAAAMREADQTLFLKMKTSSALRSPQIPDHLELKQIVPSSLTTQTYNSLEHQASPHVGSVARFLDPKEKVPKIGEAFLKFVRDPVNAYIPASSMYFKEKDALQDGEGPSELFRSYLPPRNI